MFEVKGKGSAVVLTDEQQEQAWNDLDKLIEESTEQGIASRLAFEAKEKESK